MAFKSDAHRRWYFVNKKKGTFPSAVVRRTSKKPRVSSLSLSRSSSRSSRRIF